jgi:hypothetical protein
LNLPGDGYEPDQCLDFDFAVMDWWDRFDAYRREQKLVTPPKTNRHQIAVPKYDSDAEILQAHYGLGGPGAQTVDPVVAAMTDDDLAELLDGWDA